MNLHFCDLCNESIPQADLDQARAVRRGERLICAACEAAMSPAPLHTAPVATGLGTVALPRHAPEPSGGSSVLAVSLAFSSVALVVGVGAGAYLFWRLEDETTRLSQSIADVARVAPEQARTVSAGLVEETEKREGELAAARAELSGLASRVQELEHASVNRADLERRVGRLDERLAALDDLSARVEHQGGALDQLANTVASEMQAAATRAKEKEKEAPPRASEPVVDARASDKPVASAPGGAQWQGWVTDLTSANSGTRWQAVQSLGGTGDPAVVPHLVPMLKDADIFVRMAVCRHLGSLSSIEAIPALIDTLEDEEASVREAALVALRAISGQSIPFDPLARDGERSKRVRAWRDWWEQASKEPAKGKTKG